MNIKTITASAAISTVLLTAIGCSDRAMAQESPTGTDSDNGRVSECWPATFDKNGPDPRGGETFRASYCTNISGAPIYTNESWPNPVDHLRTTTSWFVCKIETGPPNGESSPHPNRWLYTQGDDEGEWGWVSDKYVYDETNSVASC